MAGILCDLTARQLQQVEDSGLSVTPYQSGDRDLFFFNETDIGPLLQVLNVEISKQQASGLEDINLVTLRAVSGQPRNMGGQQVILVGNQLDISGRPLDGISQVLMRVLSPAVGKKIVVHPIGGALAPPLTDGDFHVFLYASSKGERRYTPPEQMWGIDVESRSKSYRPSGQGRSIMARDSEWSAAELVGDNLYVHHDLMDGTRNEVMILERICEEVVRIIPGVTTLAAGSAAAPQHSDARRKMRDAYIKACGTRVGEQVKALTLQRDESRATVEKLRGDLAQAQQLANVAQARLDALQTGNAGVLDRLGQEFDTLVKHPKVTDVRVEGDKIKVYTTTLNCKDPRPGGKLHEIGQFRIELSTSGDGQVRWFNQTRQVNAGQNKMQAPHVRETGVACLGNTEETFARLLADQEYAQAAFMGIEFVQSVNVNDGWGQHVNKWPEARSQEDA